MEGCEIAAIDKMSTPKLYVFKPQTLVRHAKVVFVAGIPHTPHLDAHIRCQDFVWQILSPIRVVR